MVGDLEKILVYEDLPGVTPADWLVAALLMDEDETGASSYESPHGWTLQMKRMRPALVEQGPPSAISWTAATSWISRDGDTPV
jgi:hypothetical protein